MNKTILYVILGLIVLGGALYGYKMSMSGEDKEKMSEKEEKNEFSPEIEKVLEDYNVALKQLAEDPVIVSAAQFASEQNKDLSESEIKTLDDEWRAMEGDDPHIQTFMTNEGAGRLLTFIDEYEGFPEIFFTDVHGLNVSLTNPTSDYYQADEEWWVDGYAGGVGKAYHGAIEYDESSESSSVSLYIPIYDVNSQVVGVMKAVLSLEALHQGL